MATTLRRRIEAALNAATLPRVGAEPTTVPTRASDSPPMVIVRYSGPQPDDETYTADACDVWCVVLADRDDPAEVSGPVRDILTEAGFGISAVTVTTGTPPGCKHVYDCVILSVY